MSALRGAYVGGGSRGRDGGWTAMEDRARRSCNLSSICHIRMRVIGRLGQRAGEVLGRVAATCGRSGAATPGNNSSSQLDAGCTAPTTAMAQQQAAYAQPFQQQNRGTLVPGQSISVNKYTVQVERYLSQGMALSRCRYMSLHPHLRWLRACLSRAHGDSSIWHYTSRLKADCGPK